ncbi:MAG: NAD(P)/FAD-dependent oxidoreductase [Alphaproteobacteria bacterium]
MAARPTFVVIGAGHAGGCALKALRDAGFDGRLVAVGDETYPPYERPPLSKELLITDDDPARTYLHGSHYYEDQEVELRLGVEVERLDASARRVELAGGGEIDYDRVLITTGSRVRELDVPGAELPGVTYLRTIDDALAIRAGLHERVPVVVVGGGYIGLEVAAAARGRGSSVTVLEALDVVMNRVVAPEVGRFFAELHADHGVSVVTGVTAARFEGRDRVERVVAADGRNYPAGLVVVGIGIVPNVELAGDAGLRVASGVVVDAYGRTSKPDVFAAGDVTNHWNPVLRRRLRLESWQNAQNQAIAVAKAMAGGGEPYAEVPWFWSNQYDLNLQMVGVPDSWDRLVYRGDVGARRFTVFYLKGAVIVGANTVNNARDIRPARRLIAEAKAVEEKALADEDVPLKKLLKA